MGSSLSLIHLPAQSGKTRKMTDLQNKWNHLFDYTGNHKDSINVVFTSNTKLLTKQTASRIKKDVDDASQVSELSEDDDDLSIDMDVKEKESKTLAWISSAKKLSVNDVFAKMTSDDENEINNIICCTNKTRMKSVWELLTKLNKKFVKRNFNKKVTSGLTKPTRASRFGATTWRRATNSLTASSSKTSCWSPLRWFPSTSTCTPSKLSQT